MNSTTKPEAGWYRDPSRRHEHRWWNGAQWTPHVMSLGMRSLDYGDPEPTARTVAEETPTVTDDVAPPPWHWPRWIVGTVLAGVALLAVGALLPWAEASSKAASFSRSGIDGNGGAALAAAVAIVLLGEVVRPPELAAAVTVGIALIAGAVGVHEALDVSHRADRLVARFPTLSAGVGAGIWVTLAGAAIALVGGVMGFVVASRRR